MSKNYQTISPSEEAGGPHKVFTGNPAPPINDNDGDEPDADDSPMSEEDVQALIAAARATQEKIDSMRSSLANDIEGKLSKRMGTRKSKENQWLEALRIYLGSLSSYNIVTGDYPFGTNNNQNVVHRPEFNFIRQKCNIAIAQTITHQFAGGDKNWMLQPPKVIDLDPHDMAVMIQQSGNPNITPLDAIRLKTDLMEREIEYHYDLTNYAAEMRKALVDRVVLGTGVMKGPLNAGKLVRTYEKQTTSDGQVIRIPSYKVDMVPLIYRVNLWYFFPDDTVTDIEKAEDVIEVHPMSKMELLELTKHKGYFADQIELCLKEEPKQYTNSPFNDPAYLTQGINLLKNRYLVLEYHGPLKKSDLDLLGVETDDSPLDDVYGEVWVCNSRVIRLQTSTIEGCYKLPYCCCVWEPDPATIPGFGVPMLARDQQRVVNEAYKMLLDNAGVSAGPQVVVDTTIIKPVEGGNEVTPFKVWTATEYGADISKAIMFFTPENSFDGLSNLINLARGFADEESSINLLSSGANPAGAMDSATGMALVNENALTPLFFKSEEWDDHIVRPLLQSMYDWEMQYNPKEEIKGTFQIDVRTPTAYLRQVMDEQKLDKLFQEIAQGSPIGEYVDMAELCQARLNLMKLPCANIIKSPQQIAQEQANKPPPQPDPNMLKAQAALQANQIDGARLQLEQQRLQFEQQKHATDTNLQYAIQQQTNQSKEKQHEIDLAKAQIESGNKAHAVEAQTAQAGMAINAQLQGTGMQVQAQKQIAGLKHVQHVQSLQVKQQEIASKEKQAQAKTELELRNIRVNSPPRVKNTANRDLTKHEPKD